VERNRSFAPNGFAGRDLGGQRARIWTRRIDELIAAAQAKFPGLRFSLLKPADGFGDHARFSWGLGPQGREPIIKGTDFVVRDGDRIRSVVGFLDQVPAGS